MAPIRTNKAIVAAAASGAAVTLFGCGDSGSKNPDQCDNYMQDLDNCPQECDKQQDDSCAVKNAEAEFQEDDCKEYFGDEAWIEDPETCLHECQLKDAIIPVPQHLVGFPEGDARSDAIWKVDEHECVGVITVNDADSTTYDATVDQSEGYDAACNAQGLTQAQLLDDAELKFYHAEYLNSQLDDGKDAFVKWTESATCVNVASEDVCKDLSSSDCLAEPGCEVLILPPGQDPGFECRVSTACEDLVDPDEVNCLQANDGCEFTAAIDCQFKIQKTAGSLVAVENLRGNDDACLAASSEIFFISDIMKAFTSIQFQTTDACVSDPLCTVGNSDDGAACMAAVVEDQEACAAFTAGDASTCVEASNCKYTPGEVCKYSGADIQCGFEGETDALECSWSLKQNNQCVSVKDAECALAAPTAFNAAGAYAAIDEDIRAIVAATWEIAAAEEDEDNLYCLGVISQASTASMYSALSVTEGCSQTAVSQEALDELNIQFINTTECGDINGCLVEFDENGVVCRAAAEIAACGAVEDASEDSCAAVSTGEPAKCLNPLAVECAAIDDADACAAAENCEVDGEDCVLSGDNACDVDLESGEICPTAEGECVFTEGNDSSYECRFEKADAEDAEFISEFCAERDAGCYNPTEAAQCTIEEFDTEDKCNGEAGCAFLPKACEINWPTDATEYEALCESDELAGTYVEAQSAKCENPIIAECAAIIDDAEACAAQDGCEVDSEDATVCVHSAIDSDPCDVAEGEVCPEECVSTEAAEQRCELETDPCASQGDECTDAEFEEICVSKGDECVGEYQKPFDPFADEE